MAVGQRYNRCATSTVHDKRDTGRCAQMIKKKKLINFVNKTAQLFQIKRGKGVLHNSSSVWKLTSYYYCNQLRSKPSKPSKPPPFEISKSLYNYIYAIYSYIFIYILWTTLFTAVSKDKHTVAVLQSTTCVVCVDDLIFADTVRLTKNQQHLRPTVVCGWLGSHLTLLYSLCTIWDEIYL